MFGKYNKIVIKIETSYIRYIAGLKGSDFDFFK
jgi:hypothetical protein